jgi:nucleotide-binding universal stress UspA family protein
MEIKKIMVCHDFTGEADCAVNHAVGVAKAPGAEVVVVHIVDKNTLEKLKKERKDISDVENRLKTITDQIAGEGVRASFIAREGDIFTTIAEIGEEIGASLIIFGTHGVKGLQQHLLGAFALKVVVSAKCPVVIVQRRKIRPHGYKKIVLPVDEGAYCKQMARPVAVVARMFGAEVLVLPKNVSDEHFRVYIRNNMGYVKKVLEEENANFTLAEPNGSSNFHKQVIEYAAANDADLISIITQEKMDRDVKELFVGSEDVRIINNAPEIPTLCINAFNALLAGGVMGVSTG